MHKYICLNCNKEFFAKSKDRVYCSRSCQFTYQRNKWKLSPHTCPQCGKEYETSSFRQKYCSYKCYWDFRRTNSIYPSKTNKISLSVNTTCNRCGKEFTAKSYYVKYCSNECRHIKHKVHICHACGKEFYGNKNKYCSVDCLQRSREIIKLSRQKECSYCKSIFIAKGKREYERRKYCSSKCANMAQLGRSVFTDSNHVEIVNDLRELGISVFDMSQIGYGIPDLLVGYNGNNYLFEIKTPKENNQNELTYNQINFFREWTGQVNIVYSLEDILNIISIPVA